MFSLNEDNQFLLSSTPTDMRVGVNSMCGKVREAGFDPTCGKVFVFVGKAISNGDSLNFGTLLIAHITFNLPYVILNVLPKLRMTSGALREAALDLGCPPVKAFFKVILPNISSGIFAGFLMSLTLSIDDFVISYYTTGADFQTLPLMIYSMTRRKVKPDMYALSTIIFVVILVMLIIVNMYDVKGTRQKNGRRAAQ